MANLVHKSISAEVNDMMNINLSHIERLYHEVVTPGGAVIGVIDIYLDAPNYNLVFDKSEGFTCVDDIARAAVFYCRYYARNPSAGHLYKIESLLSTIFYLQDDGGYFYNFIFPDISINKTHINSVASPNFWSWRALWALSEVQLLDVPELKHAIPKVKKSINLLLKNIPYLIDGNENYVNYYGIKISEFVGNMGTDQIAVILASLTNCYRFSPEERVSRLINIFGNALLKTQVGNKTEFPHYAFLSWKNLWHAWGNCQSCALLYSGMITGNESFIDAGKNEVMHLFPYLISSGYMSSFGIKLVNGKLESFDKEQFPQISYDIRVMVFAALFAYDITEELEYATLAANLVMWLFGSNTANYTMYNSSTGRCYDGIDSPTSVNRNSGAESTIEALLILNELDKYPIIKQIIADKINTKSHG